MTHNSAKHIDSSRRAFPILILLARPGAGKSEVIHYLHSIDLAIRLSKYHLAQIEEIDDFPYLWTWFEEDDLLEKMGLDRLHSTKDGYFKNPSFWNLLILRIGASYQKKLRDNPNYHQTRTSIIEFSRGKEHGGYKEAFRFLAPEIADKSAILYIDVSYEESLRKNLKRADPMRPDSILQHSLSPEKMERLYKETDWDDIAGAQNGFLMIQGYKVPYVVMNNEDDVTTTGGATLGDRLEDCLTRLWKTYIELQAIL
jgi:hypothetical protein